MELQPGAQAAPFVAEVPGGQGPVPSRVALSAPSAGGAKQPRSSTGQSVRVEVDGAVIDLGKDGASRHIGSWRGRL